MKRFITHTVIFSFAFFIGVFLLILLADGSADESYEKFSSPKQSALIVGSSRAGQGLIPEILNSTLDEHSFYNYAFSIRNTPYGEPYYRSIKKKLDPETNNSGFIICVTPWTISATTEDPEDSLNYRELGSAIDRTHFVSMDPNIEYIIESYQQKNMNFILKKFKKGDYQTFFVHDDGWLEVVIESDMISTKERTDNKVNSYRKKQKNEYTGVSQHRLKYLERIIELLVPKGRVYLLRIPINDDMYEIENLLDPQFDERMSAIAKKYNIHYINEMDTRAEYDYTDGHHLTIESSKRFSKKIADQIKAFDIE
ncbi:MAG: hypothetical protein KJO77_05120 [Bacteroidia bacterium]|nr:hypothetical protein [Bacteroidia bacterium]NND52323.1 hypothetical protein [Flavobacteriaceae bacterium]